MVATFPLMKVEWSEEGNQLAEMQALFRAIPAGAPRGARCLSSVVEDATMKTASSGVKIGSVAMQGELATVTAWVNAGSRFEGDKNGVAHLFQQSALMGKANEINELGGMVSGCTTREHIVFEAKVLKEHVPKATALLGEMMKPVGDVSDAKNAVQSLIAEAEANPAEHVMEHLHDTAYLGTAMSKPVRGTAESVANLSADDVAAFAGQFSGDRVNVAVAGAFDQGAFETAADAAFGSLKGSGSGKPAGAIFTGSDLRMRFDSMDAARVAFAYETPGYGAPEMYPLMVMQAYLGSHDRATATIPGRNRTSKLALDLGEQEAAPAYTAFNEIYSDTGLFGVLFQAPDNALEDTMWYTLNNLVRLCHTASEDEVNFAKTQLKAQIASSLSSSSGAAHDLARSLSYAGRPIPMSEIMAEVDKVNAASVRATALKVINDNEHALAAVGPIYELPDINWIRRRSFWLRY